MISKQLRNDFFQNTPCLKDVKTVYDCAWWAYTDLKQAPLAGIGPWEGKAAYREAVCRLIDGGIETLLKSDVPTQDGFDSWHKKICEAIIVETKKRNVPLVWGFHHGMAQKWVNITLKNMLAVDLWQGLDSLVPYLHAPVDSKIIDLAKKAPLEVKAPKGTPWSRWSYEQYIEYQNDLRRAIEAHTGYACPMAWEFAVWKSASWE